MTNGQQSGGYTPTDTGLDKNNLPLPVGGSGQSNKHSGQPPRSSVSEEELQEYIENTIACLPPETRAEILAIKLLQRYNITKEED
jgi:hypothetical protein